MKIRTFLICALLAWASPLRPQESQPGQAVDLAPFGHVKSWDGITGVEWDEPRDVNRVEVEFSNPAEIPANLKLEYWVASWPPKFRGGWTQTDSPWQGQWREAAVKHVMRGRILALSFTPLSEVENPNVRNAPGYSPVFRRTLKLRLGRSGGPVRYSVLRVYGRSSWNIREIDVETGCEGKEPRGISATAYNGKVLSLTSRDSKTFGARLRVLYTEHEPASNDRTILTIRAGQQAFGVSVDDVWQRKGVYVRPLGAFISDAAMGVDFASWLASGSLLGGEDILSRTSREPEQSLGRAMTEIPALAVGGRSSRHPWRYIPLGFPAAREKYGLEFNGNVFINKHSAKAMKEDLARMRWNGEEIAFRLGTGTVPDFRERERSAEQSLLEDYLPFVSTRWKSEGIEYEEQAYATMLFTPLDDDRLRGDEPTLLHLRLIARNIGPDSREAWVWLNINPPENRELKDGMVLGTGEESGVYPHPRLRAVLESAVGALELRPMPPASAYSGQAVLWKAKLQGETAQTLEIKIPFRTFEGAEDLESVHHADFSTRRQETVDYWKKSLAAGMKINVPDQEFNRLFRTALQHIEVSIQRDVQSGLDMCPCGTYDYNIFANETFMQARLLDLRGLHDLAWRCMKPIVELQGSHPFPGRFKDGSAIFHGVRIDADHDYTHSGYNLNHGWTLWALAEHFFLTGDRKWLESVLPRVLRGANWIIEERRATMQKESAGEPVPEYGLLPPGQLEDNEEWHYWFAVNAYAYRGLNAAAEAVAVIVPEEGARLKKEAASYREDIRRAAFHGMSISPVVPLRDGTFVPAIPPRTPLHGREFGWIRNILYGSHVLLDCGIISPDEPIADWILADHEDNLFMSEESFSVPDRDWFSRGGITLQPNLVNTVVSYLQRDQIPPALRSLYNTFSVSYYPDVAAFTEWVPTLGTGGGPFFKTSDEAGFLAWVRLMLVRESGDRLYLNTGAPRAWFLPGRVIEVSHAASFFGELGFRVESSADQDLIQASLTHPTRSRPREILLRLRHPDGRPMKRVELNGRDWEQFDAAKELISIPPSEDQAFIRAHYK